MVLIHGKDQMSIRMWKLAGYKSSKLSTTKKELQNVLLSGT